MNQIINLNAIKNVLKRYRYQVWDLIEDVDAFNLIYVPRDQNKHADKLASFGVQFDISKEIHNIER